jgi:hypothetical protein
MSGIEWGDNKQSSDHANAVFRLWREYRNYCVHEDTLINHRLQRILIIQGFLFAAEGTLLPKLCDLFTYLPPSPPQTASLSGAPLHPHLIQLFLYSFFSLLVAICGAATARIIQPALRAACNATDTLEERWNDVGREDANKLGIPELRGGGHSDAQLLGVNHVLRMPVLFQWVWLIFSGAILLSVGLHVYFVSR